ncbi:hypothetical protein EDEG_03342 [Edhazardia aedis USNM 41457]|uniref:Serine aminopeptidase S33 domain-containing protein n=1 Tax=Edhazardia aedis (strain USNM 41457) TaxID=1003232 RepID=J9D3V4_EDHAE|nr:hypothetical protein EDEG_03342 [Edhazardia aedis USNM 41457]|eukprot:EJW02224.1 hypothetical protein EDEG_03342 [Edhazardia aedis USNM 41457]
MPKLPLNFKKLNSKKRKVYKKIKQFVAHLKMQEQHEKTQSSESFSIETNKIEPDPEPYLLKSKLKLAKSYLRRFISSSPEWFKFKKQNYEKNRFEECSEFMKFSNVYLETNDGQTIGLHIYSPVNTNKETQICLFVHGKQTNRAHFSRKLPIDKLVENNVVIALIDCRSFGDSKGKYDVEKINLDMDRAVNYLANTYKAEKIHLISHCIGSGIAIQYYKYTLTNTLTNLVGKIILISPCISEYELALQNLSFKVLNKVVKQNPENVYSHLSHNNVELIRNTHIQNENVIVFHGMKDKIVPFDHGLKLANEMGCKLYRSESDDYYTILNNKEVLTRIVQFVNEDM